MGWFNDLFSQGATRSVTLHNPLKIDDPKIGFLDLLAGRANGVVVEDRAAFDGMFGLVEGRDTEPPVCDVLLIYCDLNADGTVDRHSCGLRDLIDAAGASIAIIASENSAESYIAAGAKGDHHPTNLIMTLERKGAAFGKFFAELFRRMFAGESMITAWVDLAPQGPVEIQHGDLPGTIFAAEISHIVFNHD